MTVKEGFCACENDWKDGNIERENGELRYDKQMIQINKYTTTTDQPSLSFFIFTPSTSHSSSCITHSFPSTTHSSSSTYYSSSSPSHSSPPTSHSSLWTDADKSYEASVHPLAVNLIDLCVSCYIIPEVSVSI